MATTSGYAMMSFRPPNVCSWSCFGALTGLRICLPLQASPWAAMVSHARSHALARSLADGTR